MAVLAKICLVLALIGTLNWGLVGLFNFDLVAALTGNRFGETNAISRVIYVVVAIAGIIAFVYYIGR